MTKIIVTSIEELMIKAYREVENGMQKMNFEKNGIAVEAYQIEDKIRIDIKRAEKED